MSKTYFRTNPFKGKKITRMGFGLLGKGSGDAMFLAQCGAKLTVTDLRPKEELETLLSPFKRYTNVTFILGEHRLEDFTQADLVIKASGVSLDSPYILAAKKAGVPVETSLSLFAKHTPATTIGITGTRGKSTVTHLIYQVLKENYKNTKTKVFLGGNVKGVSTLALLPDMKKGDLVVMELDSWQLQGFGDAKISPHIAVFTTFMKDHMNYYKNSMQKYFADKANMYKFQNKDDVLIAGSQIAPKIKNSPAKMIIPKELPVDWQLKMPGQHNRYNASLAVEAARALGVKESVIKKVVTNFKGIEGRLEFRGNKKGILYYNDTTATTPDATVVALEAFKNLYPVVLIMGGADKQLEMSKLIPFLKKYTKKIILLPGSGTDKILQNKEFTSLSPILAKNMKEAVVAATQNAAKGDVVLLSPAFASFGLFKNEFDRGEQFDVAVSGILAT